LTTLGAALYRAGRFLEAVQQLREAQTVYKPADEERQSIAYNWLFLAMAHQRLGHAEEAKSWLAKAIELIDRTMRSAAKEQPDVPPASASAPLPWNRKLTLQLLRAEAESPRR
jgi:tetratricopeptide (TPR) repeat protein